MSYRKIEVNDKIYEYVVGKVNTKIKGVGVFINEDIGIDNSYYEQCSCGPEYNCYEGDPHYLVGGSEKAVTPAVIKRLILSHAS